VGFGKTAKQIQQSFEEHHITSLKTHQNVFISWNPYENRETPKLQYAMPLPSKQKPRAEYWISWSAISR
jgi:hypothetical protein